MDIPFSRWYRAIPARRSRRQYTGEALDADTLARLEQLCAGFTPFSGVRAKLVTQSPEKVFRGAVGPYGKIKAAPAFIAFVGDMSDPHVQEKLGYVGEGIILEATAMGLATCWVGGFFRPKVAASLVDARSGERVLCVTPVGHSPDSFTREERLMTGFGLTHRRKQLGEMCSGLAADEWPGWVRAGLEAARLAPSAVNRQPWRFHVEPNSITVSMDNRPSFDFYISKRLDCGIAMLHIEVAALSEGVRGSGSCSTTRRWEGLAWECPRRLLKVRSIESHWPCLVPPFLR